jgi:hypothetical protein
LKNTYSKKNGRLKKWDIFLPFTYQKKNPYKNQITTH